MPVPEKYSWLNDIGPLPRTVIEALKLYGVHEITGKVNNPTIMEWANEVGIEAAYSSDEVPWCGLFAAVVCQRAGKQFVKNPLWALNWQNFGKDSPTPGLGDIMVFVRPGGGHVGFYVAEDSAAYHILGGNTNNQVMIARIEKKRLHAARRPLYNIQPATVQSYHVAPGGALSTDEA